MTLLTQTLEPALDRAGLVKRTLGVPDLEGGAEERKHVLLLLEL